MTKLLNMKITTTGTERVCVSVYENHVCICDELDVIYVPKRCFKDVLKMLKKVDKFYKLTDESK